MNDFGQNIQYGYGSQSTDYGSQGSSYGSQGSDYGSQGTGYGSQGTGYDSQGTGYGSQGAGYGSQGTGYGENSVLSNSLNLAQYNNGRILCDISAKNFTVPSGFSFSGDYDSETGKFKRIILGKSGALFVPKIDITVTPEGLEFVRGKERFFYPVSGIRQVFYSDYIIHHRSRNSSYDEKLYSISIMFSDGTAKDGTVTIKFLDGISSGYFARYIEQEFEKTMAIEDFAVRGESDYGLKVNAPPRIPKEIVVQFLDENLRIERFDKPINWTDFIALPMIFGVLFFCFWSDGAEFAWWIFLPIMLFLGGIGWLFMHFAYSKDLLSLEYRTFSLFRKNSAGKLKPAVSCSFSELDSVYPYEMSVNEVGARQGEEVNNVFKVRVALKNGKTYDMFKNVNCSTAEFIAGKINESVMKGLDF